MSSERTPSPLHLRELRAHVVRFRLRAEEVNLWPGKPTHSLPDDSEVWGNACVGVVDSLLECLRVVSARLERGCRIPVVNGWPEFWRYELRRLLLRLTHDLEAVARGWGLRSPGFGCMGQYVREEKITIGGEEWQRGFWLRWSEIVESAEHEDQGPLKPILVTVAASLDLCERRLEEVLTSGDLFDPDPTPPPKSVPEATDPPASEARNQGGRPPLAREKKEERWREARSLFEVCGSWEKATAAYNQAHGTRYKVSTVEKWGRDLNRTGCGRRKKCESDPRSQAA